jgi:RNA polymerase sigma-70 factor (ECF subfamily)
MPAEAFDRIVREHGAALRRLAEGYAADASEEEDLLQDILFAVWRALPAFRGECSERTFAFRVGHNRGLTYRARRGRLYGLEAAGPVADPRVDLEADAARADARAVLLRAIRGLPASHREVVMLYLEGLSHREIAEVVGTSENNAAARLSRARKALRPLLDPLAASEP